MLRLHRFDPTPCRFPPPVLPLLPQPHWPGARRPPQSRNRDDPRVFQHVVRGRYALHAAFQAAGLHGPQDRLLLPAYHCLTMVDPALSLGLQVEFYPLHADLSPDLEALRALLKTAGVGRCAVVLTHFFGFAQPARTVKALCDEADAVLIEDASHALVTDPFVGPALDLGDEIGKVAELGVASPYKFLAAPDGGLVWTSGRFTLQLPRAQAWTEECRSALSYARTLLQRPPRPSAPAAPTPMAPAREWLEPMQRPSRHYRSEVEGRASLRLTRRLMQGADLERIAAARRRNYRQWIDAVAGLAGVQAMRPQLEEDTVPYMVPLLLDEAEPAFSQLKAAGLPIWRWDEQVASRCPVAADYRLRLLHLPCHESLSSDALSWMSDTLSQVLRRGAH